MLNNVEIYNEITIIIVLYLTTLFTDYIDSARTQYNIGWCMIAVTVLNILVNMIILIVNGIKAMKMRFKYLVFKIKNFRKAKMYS